MRSFFGFSTQGRIGRLQYLLHSLLNSFLAGLLLVAIPYFVKNEDELLIAFGLTMIFMLVMETRSIILRLHDIDRPGTYALFAYFVPSYAFYLLAKEGTRGSNQYGLDPYGKSSTDHSQTSQNATVTVSDREQFQDESLQPICRNCLYIEKWSTGQFHCQKDTYPKTDYSCPKYVRAAGIYS